VLECKKWKVVVKMGVEFNGPVVVRVNGQFMPEMVIKWQPTGKVVVKFTRMVGEE